LVVYAVDFSIAAVGFDAAAVVSCTPWAYELVVDECSVQECGGGDQACSSSPQACWRAQFSLALEAPVQGGEGAGFVAVLGISSPEGAFLTQNEAVEAAQQIMGNGSRPCWYNTTAGPDRRLDLRTLTPAPTLPSHVPIEVFALASAALVLATYLCVYTPDQAFAVLSRPCEDACVVCVRCVYGQRRMEAVALEMEARRNFADETGAQYVANPMRRDRLD
jgi:hypothetical protein